MVKVYIIVDCEAPMGVGAPSVGDMTEFGAVELLSRESFYGRDSSEATFQNFEEWIIKVAAGRRPVFVSDNPAYDWQWVNFYFWKYFGHNPFGHSARRIGDFYAGLKHDFERHTDWKTLRITEHTHNPVDDAMGNAEALEFILKETKGGMGEKKSHYRIHLLYDSIWVGNPGLGEYTDTNWFETEKEALDTIELIKKQGNPWNDSQFKVIRHEEET